MPLIRRLALGLGAACLAPIAALGHGLDEAESFLARGEYEKGREIALTQVKKDAFDGRARCLAARSFLGTGQRDAAVEALKPLAGAAVPVAEEGSPEDRLWRAEGRLLLADLTGDADLAKRVVEDELPVLEEALPASPRPHVLKLRMFLAAGQKHDAKAEAKAAWTKAPEDPDLLLAIGRPAEVLTRNPDHVAARVEHALELLFGKTTGLLADEEEESQGESGYQGGGGAYVPKEAARREALTHLAHALKVNPRSADAHAAAAAWHYFDGDVPGFEASAALARATNPACGLPELWVAALSENPRDHREAIRWLRKAVAFDPFLKQAWLLLGRHCMDEGYLDEATAAMRKVRAMDRFNVTAKNCLTLLEDLPNHFDLSKTEHFTVRLAKGEADLLRPWVHECLETWYADLAARYAFEPELPIHVEIYDDRQDFAVRGFGTPGAPYLGVCLGRVVVNQSPSALAPQKRCWAQVLRHELTHIFSVQAAGGLVSQWFTEGLSTYEERRFRPEWDWEEGIDEEIFDAFHDGTLLPVSRLGEGFRGPKVRMYYYVSSLACEYIDGKWGGAGLARIMAAYRKGSGAKTPAQEMMRGWTGARDPQVVKEALGITIDELDAGFRTWLGERLARIRIQPKISRAQTENLAAQAAAAPGDLLLAVRLARGCFQNGLLDEAEKQARRVAEKTASWKEGPDRARLADAYVVLGHLAFDRDDFKGARAHFEEADRLGCEDFYLLHALGTIAADEDGRAEEAIRYFDRARASFPRQVYGGFDTYRKVYEIAKELADEKRMAGAVEGRIRIVHEDDRSRRWLMNRYRAAGRHAEAIDTGLGLVWFDPLDARTHLAMAESYVALGEAGRALRSAESGIRALKYLPDYAPGADEAEAVERDLGVVSAELYAAAGRPEEALRAADGALMLDAGCARALAVKKRLAAAGASPAR